MNVSSRGRCVRFRSCRSALPAHAPYRERSRLRAVCCCVFFPRNRVVCVTSVRGCVLMGWLLLAWLRGVVRCYSFGPAACSLLTHSIARSSRIASRPALAHNILCWSRCSQLSELKLDSLRPTALHIWLFTRSLDYARTYARTHSLAGWSFIYRI